MFEDLKFEWIKTDIIKDKASHRSELLNEGFWCMSSNELGSLWFCIDILNSKYYFS